MSKLSRLVAGVAALAASQAFASPVVTNTVNAATLAGTIAGPGITISNPTLTYNGSITQAFPTGTFTNGLGTVGFGSGIVLTTGTTACVAGPNNDTDCGLDRGGSNDTTSLKFDFTSATGKVFFRYVFASEEYNEYVLTQFNDEFDLLLNGVDIAQLPGGAGNVSINNVNSCVNSAYYRSNRTGDGSTGCPTSKPSLGLNIQYDGLTVVLTASGEVNQGTNTFEFVVRDRGDNSWDSAVFIEAGSFSGENPQVPEPGTLALLGLGLAGAAALRRRRA